MKQLVIRHSDLVQKWDTGTPQGCSLSPLLFAGTTGKVLELLSSDEHIKDIIAFADDVVIACDKNYSNTAIQHATALFQEVGLSINM